MSRVEMPTQTDFVYIFTLAYLHQQVGSLSVKAHIAFVRRPELS